MPTAVSVSKTVRRRPYQNEYMEHLEEPVEEPTQTQATPPDPANPTPEPVMDPKGAEEITFKDRYGNLRRYHDQKMKEAQTAITDLTQRLTVNTQQFTLPKTEQEVEAWRKQYPEIYDLVRTIARREAQDERTGLDQKFEQLKTGQRALAKDRAYAQLVAIHPDFSQLRETEDFHLWAQGQPAQIQSWLYDNEDDATLAARAVDMYKHDRGIGRKAPDTKKVVDASKMVTPNSGTEPKGNNKEIIKLSWVASLTPRQFEKHEERIEEARRDGRLEDDLR